LKSLKSMATFMKSNKRRRFVVKTIKFDGFHLPHPEDVAMLLGLPDNIRKMIDSAEFFYQKDLPLKSSTRAKISKEGLAKPSWEKLITWVFDLPIPIFELFNLFLFRKCSEATKAGSNAGQWFSHLHGFKQSPKRSINDHEFQPLINFIDARANVDALVLKNGKKLIKTGKLSIDDAKAQWACQQQLWSDLKVISTTVLTEYDAFVENYAIYIKMNQSELSLRILPAVIAMKFDFYLAAIAHYEIGLALYMQRNSDDVQFTSFKDTFSSVSQNYSLVDEKHTCFGAMLIELRNSISDHGQDMSWRALSSYIAIEESGDSGELLKNKQYNQLKDWRNGKNMPSDKKLEAFIKAAITSVGNEDITFSMFYFRIAKGIDKLAAQYEDQIGTDKVQLMIREVVACYPKYLEYYKKQYLVV